MDPVARAPEGRRTFDSTFLFGVGDSGYQSEGGYNGPGQPRNNWARWEESGRAVPAGAASAFWSRYPEHLDRAAEIGCNGFRMGVERTRCEPSRGAVDVAAIEHYRRILEGCVRRGIEPVVALHHFTHPEWLGADFWLDDGSPAEFARWVELIVPHLAPHCHRWTTINEINAYAIGTYLIGYFPPGHRFRRGLAVRAMSNMIAAHVLAYDIIHRLQPEAQVGTSTYAFWSYDVDRLPIDLLMTRSEGVTCTDVPEWLADRRVTYNDTVLSGLTPTGRALESTIHRGLQLFLPGARHWRSALDAVGASEHERPFDVIQLNYYDPRLSNYLRVPGRTSGGARIWGPDPKHWEQKPAPEHLVAYLQANETTGAPIWILESGLCNPVIDGEQRDRPDGWNRPRYLREHLAALTRALDAGIDVRAYFHWCLFDSYQWGEYDSRFGLCGVKRDVADRDVGGFDQGGLDDGDVKLLDTDSMGNDAAGAYRALIAALRAGDRSVLA